METKINKSELKQESEHKLKLVEIVFNELLCINKFANQEVIPKPIGNPNILNRCQTVDHVTPYPYYRTIYSNPRFINSLEEDIEKLAPSSVNAYSLSECEIIHDNGLKHERYAVQFYRI